jgi:hypothetical protein
MNERIKELAEQAGFNMHNDLIDGHNFNYEIEKLANIVIQECIGVVENLSPGYKDYRDQIEDAFRRDCVAEMKLKFGIEA